MDEIICKIDQRLKDCLQQTLILNSFFGSLDILFYISQYLEVDDLRNFMVTCKHVYALKNIPMVQIRIVKMQIKNLQWRGHLQSSQEQQNEKNRSKTEVLKHPHSFTKQLIKFKTTAQHLVTLQQVNKKSKRLALKKNVSATQIQAKKVSEKLIKNQKHQRMNQINNQYNEQLKQLLRRRRYLQIKNIQSLHERATKIGKQPKNFEASDEKEKIGFDKKILMDSEKKPKAPFTSHIDKIMFEIIVKKKQQRIRLKRQATLLGQIKKTYFATKQKISQLVSYQHSLKNINNTQ